MQISVKHNLDKIAKQLSNIKKKQIPFAASQALNDTAFAARQELRKQSYKKIDRPTKFTVNAFQVIKSTKRNLQSVVYIEDKRWKYLQDIIEGTTKTHRKKGYAIPVNSPLNKYGNIPGRTLLKNKRQFISTINGVSGVWERVRGSNRLKLVVAFEKRVTHEKRFNFSRIVGAIVQRKFGMFFNQRLQNALRAAR